MTNFFCDGLYALCWLIIVVKFVHCTCLKLFCLQRRCISLFLMHQAPCVLVLDCVLISQCYFENLRGHNKTVHHL